MDTLLLDFIGQNYVTIYVCLRVLKGLDLNTPESGIYQMYINHADTLGLCAQRKDIVGIYNLFLYSPAGESVFRQYGQVTILAAAAI